MIWLEVYLGVALLCCAIAFVFLRGPMGIDDLVGVAAAILLALGWPLLLLWILLWLLPGSLLERLRPQRRIPYTSREPPPFVVTRADLQAPLSIAEIEVRERVLDPLGAVPDLPFGHLHAAWRRFTDDMPPETALAPFSRLHKTYRTERYEGYAVVAGGAVQRWFVARVFTEPDSRP